MFPPEYLALVAEIENQLEKYAARAEQVASTGIGDTRLHVENARLSELFHRLDALRKGLCQAR